MSRQPAEVPPTDQEKYMDFKVIVRMALDEYLDDLRGALDGLAPEERRFQPSPEANHIDFAVWHMARVEDRWVQDFARRSDTVWQRDGWYQRLGLPESGSGFGYTADQVTNLPRFDFDELMVYYGAVREATVSYLDSLTEEDLDVFPDPEHRPGYTIGKMWSHLIVEESQHTGHVAYIRGLQRGLGQ